MMLFSKKERWSPVRKYEKSTSPDDNFINTEFLKPNYKKDEVNRNDELNKEVNTNNEHFAVAID